MMNLLFLIVGLVSLMGDKSSSAESVHLKGRLVDMGTQEVEMVYTGVVGDFGNSRSFMLHTDAQGYFDTILPLEAPAYFNISRNILYLTPGDDLEVYLTPDTRQATFSGQGSVANTFLKDRLYPKGGSFLMSGDYVFPSFEETKIKVDSLANIKLLELDALKGVNQKFKENERRRIQANLVNSYLMYPAYSEMQERMDKEEYRHWMMEFQAKVAPDVNSLMRQFVQNCYLDIVDVRNVIIYNLGQEAFLKGMKITPEMKEIETAMEMLSVLDKTTDSERLGEVEKQIGKLKNVEIRTALENKLLGVKGLMGGEPAYDIVMIDTAGNELKLSEFKGKVIYLDCWATWCGPCIQESPAFNKLQEQYKGQEIVFIQLSTDTARKSWLNFLKHKHTTAHQYNSVDHESLKEKWQIKYIPRFILIDKDFKIYQAFAPRPSDSSIIECLDKLLQK